MPDITGLQLVLQPGGYVPPLTPPFARGTMNYTIPDIPFAYSQMAIFFSSSTSVASLQVELNYSPAYTNSRTAPTNTTLGTGVMVYRLISPTDGSVGEHQQRTQERGRQLV